MAKFGERVRERRKQLGLGLREFAARADIDAGNLSRIERGRVAPPRSRDTLDRICRALEIEPDAVAAADLRAQAALDAGRLPAEVMRDEETMTRLPALLRTATGRPLDLAPTGDPTEGGAGSVGAGALSLDEAEDEAEREVEVSWISMWNARPGTALPGPASPADLPRAKPRITFDALDGDHE